MAQAQETDARVKVQKLLLVEDEPDIRVLCKHLFQEAGYAVTDVPDARQGARAAMENTFDIAVIDYKLPDSPGTTLVRWMRSHCPQTPAILFSAFADWDLFYRASGCGARDVVAKLSSPKELLRVVKESSF
jgi:two-component system response regulator AtoC